jgi:predicted transcriptional regulator YheO
VAGNVTGRSVGGPVTDFVLNLLAAKETPDDVVDYTTQTADGRTLKSSTIFIRDNTGAPIGVFCINLDVTGLLAASRRISELATASSALAVHKSFSKDAPNLLASMIRESMERVVGPYDPNEDLTREKRQELVGDLEARGVFRIRRSVPTVADVLGVSRHTIYKDINEIKEQLISSNTRR